MKTNNNQTSTADPVFKPENSNGTAIKPEEQLKVELPVQDWEAVLQIIEQSNAPHQTVKQVQEIILNQLRSQIDTVKKK